jgi:hypothetical protein
MINLNYFIKIEINNVLLKKSINDEINKKVDYSKLSLNKLREVCIKNNIPITYMKNDQIKFRIKKDLLKELKK